MADTQFLAVLTLSAAYDVCFLFYELCPDFPVPEDPSRGGFGNNKIE